MKYAINLADLTAWQKHKPCHPMLFLVRPHIGEPVDINTNVDGAAVVLACPEEQAAAIVELLRKNLKRHELRMYRSKTGDGGWKAV